jgi:hypothetical protein
LEAFDGGSEGAKCRRFAKFVGFFRFGIGFVGLPDFMAAVAAAFGTAMSEMLLLLLMLLRKSDYCGATQSRAQAPA